jgi:hypothetical protein
MGRMAGGGEGAGKHRAVAEIKVFDFLQGGFAVNELKKKLLKLFVR